MGALIGGVVFNIWSMVTEFGLAPAIVGKARMDIAGMNGWFLKVPRISTGLFFAVWIVSLFVIAYGMAWAYAAVRATVGKGPGTAAKVGLLVAFAAGFPMNFAHATFDVLSARFWLMWTIEIGIGSLLAALAAGWVYQDPPQAS
jgi:uncharacterized membrane protein YczE